jgi:four helix bundle protein
MFGVTMQMRRTSTAIATRIAEGCGCDSDAVLAADLRRSASASSELEYLVLLARDLGYLEPEIHDGLNAEIVDVRQMAYGLLRKL